MGKILLKSIFLPLKSIKYFNSIISWSKLTLLHSERPKLQTILAYAILNFLNAIGLKAPQAQFWTKKSHYPLPTPPSPSQNLCCAALFQQFSLFGSFNEKLNLSLKLTLIFSCKLSEMPWNHFVLILCFQLLYFSKCALKVTALTTICFI